MFRNVLGVIVGAVVGGVFNMAVIIVNTLIYPMPEGTDMYNAEQMATYIRELPASAYLLVLIAHAGGTFLGGLVAAWIGKSRPMLLAGIVAAFFLLGGVMNVLQLPAPLWFEVMDVISYLPSGLLGGFLAARRATPAPVT